MSRKQTDYATIRPLASVVAFPLFWSLETSVVGGAAGLWWALAFFVSLPLGGVIAYRYLAGTGRLRHSSGSARDEMDSRVVGGYERRLGREI